MKDPIPTGRKVRRLKNLFLGLLEIRSFQRACLTEAIFSKILPEPCKKDIFLTLRNE